MSLKWLQDYQSIMKVKQKGKRKKQNMFDWKKKRNEMNRNKKWEQLIITVLLKKKMEAGKKKKKRDWMSAGDEQGYWKTECGTIQRAGDRPNQKEMIRRDEGLCG